jgi:hypothetical protein
MNTMYRLGRRATKALLGLAFMAGLAACGGGGGTAGTPILGGGTGTTTVADLSVLIDKTSVTNTGAEFVTLTVTSVDANRSAIGGVPIKFAVDNSGVVTPAATSTDAKTGVLTATVGIGADRTNRTISVGIASGSITKTVSFKVVDSVSGGNVADLAMSLDKTTMPNDGSQTIRLTITSLDAARSAIGGAPIKLAVTDSNALVNANGATATDALTGQITATISISKNSPVNRSITVQAASGTVSRSISFNVVDAINTVPKASDITVLLDKTNIGNAGSDVVNVTVTAVDSSRNVVSGIPVTFAVDNSATIAAASNLTDASGQVTAKVQIGSDKSNRLITVTAKSDTITRSATFTVTGATIQATAVPTLPAAGGTGTVQYRVVDINSAAMPGVSINVSAPGLPSANGVTDANGAYVYTYTAPSTPGPIDITAIAAGRTSVQTVTVSSGATTIPPATPAVTSASLASSPAVVRVNTTTDKSNRTEIRALFQAAANAPVKNVRVRFDLNGDPNSIGGTIGSGTSLVYSDSQGVAVTNYSPDTRSSPTSGVFVRACWDYNDFAIGTCPNQVLTTLTVVADPISITIGTNNAVGEGTAKLTYTRQYVVLVVDAAGNPKPDVQITPSIDLLYYGKGYYIYNSAVPIWELHYRDRKVDAAGAITAGPTGNGYGAICANEDTNRNGLIDTGEDVNGNGQLDPRKSDVSITMVGSTKTDTSGLAIIQIEYPKSLGSWGYFKIQASAAGVLSPPATLSAWLDVTAADLKAEASPPFQLSPYGPTRYTTTAADGSTSDTSCK